MKYEVKDKFLSMTRSYERLKRISTDNGNTISFAGSQDEVEDFFNHCWHFRDWLKRESSLASKVDPFVNKSDPLKLAGDYCESLKHAGRDRKPRSGKLENVNRHLKLEPKNGRFIASARHELTIAGKKYDAFSLATDCLNEWNTFLEQKSAVLSKKT